MAKKSRKRRKSKGARRAARRLPPTKKVQPTPSQPEDEGQVAATAAPSGYSVKSIRQAAARRKTNSSSPATQMTSADYAAQYEYVRQDLRRIAVIAATFLVVMIALTFVLR
jgi:hypothetical protein